MADGVEGFTSNAEFIDAENPKCYAKSVCHNQRETFYVRMHSSHLYNPWDQYSFPGDSTARGLDASMKKWEFRKVPKVSFDYYLQFLRSKNENYLRRAEAEF